MKLIYKIIVQCNAKDKKFNIGQSVPEESSNIFENGADYVYVFLPCDKKKYTLDLSSSLKRIVAKSRMNFILFSCILKDIIILFHLSKI